MTPDNLDPILEKIGKILDEAQQWEFEPNDSNIGIFETVAKVLPRIMDDIDAVKCTRDDPYIGMGVIKVVGNGILFTDAPVFAYLSKLASNINIYTMTNGKTEIDFTFYGLKKVKGR